VPRFEPFPGLRYATDRVQLDDVIAPPYDVITAEEQAALEARSDYNSVRLELPRDQPDLDRYQSAARLLQQWRADGVLVRDETPSLYGYGMVFTDETGHIRHTVGVIGALGLETPGEGDIWPHERTTPKDKSDRLQLLRATRANMSPIWGLSLAKGLSELLAASATPADARLEAKDDDGVAHQLWPITDPDAIAAISAAVGEAPVVIADGHHRFETALTYRDEHRTPGAGAVMALLVELVDDQLSVRPIHRLIAGVPDDFDPTHLIAALERSFELTPTDPPDHTIQDRMAAANSLALVTAEGTWLLTPKDTSSELDSETLDAALSQLPAHELTYQAGWDLATAAVTKGTAQAAVLLRPATVARIAATGRGGQRMPPKTTYFWPKPRTGLVFREVDG